MYSKLVWEEQSSMVKGDVNDVIISDTDQIQTELCDQTFLPLDHCDSLPICPSVCQPSDDENNYLCFKTCKSHKTCIMIRLAMIIPLVYITWMFWNIYFWQTSFMIKMFLFPRSCTDLYNQVLITFSWWLLYKLVAHQSQMVNLTSTTNCSLCI